MTPPDEVEPKRPFRLEDDGAQICDVVDMRVIPWWLKIVGPAPGEDIGFKEAGNETIIGWQFEFAGHKYGNYIIVAIEPNHRPLPKLIEILTINAWQSLGRMLVKRPEETKDAA